MSLSEISLSAHITLTAWWPQRHTLRLGGDAGPL